jgi:hypothetical protein
MAEFTPQNVVQKYAYEKRGVRSYLEFEQMIGGRPWLVARTTARYWWDSGIPENMRLSSAANLADFLRVKIDDLVEG